MKLRRWVVVYRDAHSRELLRIPYWTKRGAERAAARHQLWAIAALGRALAHGTVERRR